MQLRVLLQAANIPAGLADPEVSALCHDSRQATPGCLFFAIPGAKSDGTDYIAQAAANGAVAAIAEREPSSAPVPVIVVPSARAAMADIAAAFFGHPDRSLKCVGITGTNGKTTTAFLVHHIFRKASLMPGLIGTVKYEIAGTERPAPHTTPESIELQSMLAEIRETGGRAVAMEVSSHSLVQDRVRGIEFDAAVFTNLTQDHLDYHGDMESYFKAKSILFESLAAQKNKRGRAVVNADDRFGSRLLDQISKKAKTVPFGRGAGCEFRAASIRQEPQGTTFALEARGKSYLVRTPLIGLFNVYNALGAIAASVTSGVECRTAVDALASAPQVPGRMERVAAKRNFQVFVDYAHTEDALRNALRTLRELQPARILTVFGCGGDRDRAKRPRMASAAEELSDRIIMTSDNPRSEDPGKILAEMETGLRGKGFEKIVDRNLAIRRAVELAGPGDIVLVAGKGHEKYQETNGTRTPFDDVSTAARAIGDKKGEV